MLFADDSIFFLRADMKNTENIKKNLGEYETLSGQKINLSKSEIYFGRNIVESDRQIISEVLGVRQEETLSKYLGLPMVFGHNITELFKEIIGQIWKKLQGWKEKTLSLARKEVLSKAVVQAMPTYAMSCFKIPDTLIKRIVSMISNYWWNNSKEGRGIYWCSYGKLCKDKMEGGVGFKELSSFNDALLAKQIWMMMEKPDSMMNRLLKEKFLDHRFKEPGDWLWFCVFNYDALEVNIILQGARAIWFNRNNMLVGNSGQSPFTAAKYVYQQAWSLHNGNQKLIVTDLSEGARWLKPRKGEVKVNVDGAWDSTTKRAGVGISCRDERGCICFVEAYPLDEVARCLQVEQEALVRAMLIAEEEKLSNVTFETDNVQVMNAIMRGAKSGDLN
ncbi:hypothetical protein QQ045_021430 [Rhodiola kirilowii]